MRDRLDTRFLENSLAKRFPTRTKEDIRLLVSDVQDLLAPSRNRELTERAARNALDIWTRSGRHPDLGSIVRWVESRRPGDEGKQ